MQSRLSKRVPYPESAIGEQNTGKYVMFVGDGINDTVAMQTADVGVAMASGSDIATATGDIIFVYM